MIHRASMSGVIGCAALAQWLLLSSPAAMQDRPIPGTIHFADGRSLDFLDIESLTYVPQSEEQNATAVPIPWPRHYSHAASTRVQPLAWLRSMEVLRQEIEAPQPAIRNPQVTLETVTGVVITRQYRALESCRVRLGAEGRETRTIPFASGGMLNIRKLVFKQ